MRAPREMELVSTALSPAANINHAANESIAKREKRSAVSETRVHRITRMYSRTLQLYSLRTDPHAACAATA